MAVNPAAQFPVYYGNTHIQVGGGKGGWTGFGSGAAEGAGVGAAVGSFFGPIGTGVGAVIGGVVGGVSGFMLSDGDPGYATVPGAPTFSPGTMPTQNFTNNDFGDFNTPSMQATAGGAHPGILVQPPAPPPAPPPPAAGNVGGGPVGSTGLRNLIGLNSSDFVSKGNTSYGGDTPAPHTGFAHLPPPSPGSTSQNTLLSQILSGGTAASYFKSKYGQTPNTAISKSSISVPASYNSTTSSAPPSGSSAANVRPTVRLSSASPLPVRPIGGVK